MAPRKRARAADGTFRSSGGSVTGGTGDIKPQILTATTPIPGGADDYSSVEVLVPRMIIQTTGQANVMEVLKVWFYIGIRDFADTTKTSGAFLNTRQTRITSEATNISEVMSDVANPSTFASVYYQSVITTSGNTRIVNPFVVDLTDNNGNGILIATDRFFFTSFDVSGTTAQEATVKILYRMVNIDIYEYVGIVQSQSVG